MQQHIEQARRVVKSVGAGSSFPLIVETDDRRLYLVKLRGGVAGRYGLLNEWLAGSIGQAMGLPVRRPTPVQIDAESGFEHLYIEIRELIQKSFGLNPGWHYYENSRPFSPHATEDDRPERHDLFLLDLFLLNVDRSAQNPNLLETADGLLSFDYESSLMPGAWMEHRTPHQNPGVLMALRNNPLFHKNLPPQTFDRFFERLSDLDWAAIVDDCPADWMPRNENSTAFDAKELQKTLRAAAKNPDLYRAVLQQLSALAPESALSRQQTALANRTRFEQQFIKN